MSVPIEVFPSSKDHPYTLPRGKLIVRRESDSFWSDIGHVKELTLTPSIEKVEHMAMNDGIAYNDATALKSVKFTGKMTLDSLAREALKMFLLGDFSDESQTGGTWTAEEFTIAAVDHWIDLGKKNITMSAITDDATPTPAALVEGTDYLVDWVNGLFLALSTSAKIGAVGDKFKITGTYAATDIYQIKGGTSLNTRFHFCYIGKPAKGKKMDAYVLADIAPSGDLAMVSEDWATSGLEFNCIGNTEYGKYGFKLLDYGIV